MSTQSDTCGDWIDQLGEWIDPFLWTGAVLMAIDYASAPPVDDLRLLAIAVGLSVFWTWGLWTQPARRSTDWAGERVAQWLGPKVCDRHGHDYSSVSSSPNRTILKCGRCGTKRQRTKNNG